MRRLASASSDGLLPLSITEVLELPFVNAGLMFLHRCQSLSDGAEERNKESRLGVEQPLRFVQEVPARGSAPARTVAADLIVPEELAEVASKLPANPTSLYELIQVGSGDTRRCSSACIAPLRSGARGPVDLFVWALAAQDLFVWAGILNSRGRLTFLAPANLRLL